MFHTPKKATQETSPRSLSAPLTETAGSSSSSSSNVRKSIDSWETKGPVTGHETNLPVTMALNQVAPLRPKPKAVSSKAPIEASGESPGTAKEQPKPTDRVTQARVWLRKAKTYLGESRNLKSDLKAGITLALDELFRLMKEEAAENKKDEGKTNQQKSEMGPKGTVTNPLLSSSSTAAVREEKSKGEDILKILDIQNKKLDETQDEIKKMREAISSITFAGVVANKERKQLVNKETLHSIVIASEDDNETGEKVLDKIRDVVDAKEGWVKVERIRKAKDRKIIVSCRSEEDRIKIKERIEGSKNSLTCEVVNNKDPLLILKDVLLIHSDSEILKAVKNQNEGIFRNLDPKDHRMAIKYRKRARNPLTGHIVIATSPAIWKRATDTGTIHVDLQRIRVEDQSPLVQCTRCLGFGHGKRFCKETVDLCSHCGGPHLRAECAEWLSGALSSCKNCSRAKHDQRDHNAFSQMCPVRRKWDLMARSSYAYC